MDRHKIWRIVGNHYRALEEAAPEGYTAVADIFLVGRTNHVRLAFVETDPTFPWVLLRPERKDANVAQDVRILVPEQYIERIEIRLIRSDGQQQGTGFAYGTLDDDPRATISDE